MEFLRYEVKFTGSCVKLKENPQNQLWSTKSQFSRYFHALTILCKVRVYYNLKMCEVTEL